MNWETLIAGALGAFSGSGLTLLVTWKKVGAERRKIDAEAIQTSIDSLSRLVVSLSSQLDSCTKEKSELQQKITTEGMRNMQLTEDKNELKEEIERMEKHIDELEHTIQNNNRIIADLKTTIEQLKKIS